jgi:NAD(P)-dependent dehydrogenase (short-subunit alcohol dehydrogenase family)
MSFNNTVIAVAGATGGIGSALVRHIHAAGGRAIPLGRDLTRLHALAAEIGEEGIPFDAADFDSVDAAVQQAAARAGRLDGIANCAGSLLLKPAHLTSAAEFRATLAANLDSAFAVVRAGAKAMMSTGGAIVLVSTAAARTGLANHEAIAAAKAGILGLTLSAAATYASRNIRVNCVAPGLTATPLAARITSNEAALKASQAMHALGRIGQPEEVASALAWFLDPANSWVTGQILGVDGGLGSVRPK